MTQIKLSIKGKSRRGAIKRKAIVFIQSDRPVPMDVAARIKQDLKAFETDDRQILLFNIAGEVKITTIYL